jgi:hypothetical protein
MQWSSARSPRPVDFRRAIHRQRRGVLDLIQCVHRPRLRRVYSSSLSAPVTTQDSRTPARPPSDTLRRSPLVREAHTALAPAAWQSLQLRNPACRQSGPRGLFRCRTCVGFLHRLVPPRLSTNNKPKDGCQFAVVEPLDQALCGRFEDYHTIPAGIFRAGPQVHLDRSVLQWGVERDVGRRRWARGHTA